MKEEITMSLPCDIPKIKGQLFMIPARPPCTVQLSTPQEIMAAWLPALYPGHQVISGKIVFTGD